MLDTVIVGGPRCMVCGKVHTVVLTRDQAQRLNQPGHIQNTLPDLSASDREILITGTGPECWDNLFPEDDEPEEIEYEDGY